MFGGSKFEPKITSVIKRMHETRKASKSRRLLNEAQIESRNSPLLPSGSSLPASRCWRSGQIAQASVSRSCERTLKR